MTTPLIFEKIPLIMRDIGAITKDRKNTGQGYSYRGIDDVYVALNPILVRHGCFIVPEVLDHLFTDRATKAGGVAIHCFVKVLYRVFASDGSKIETTTIGEAMDTGDKSSKKALSASYSYMGFQLFCIPTNDPQIDSEHETHELKPKNEPANVAPQDGDVNNYIVKFGKFRDKRAGDIEIVDLVQYKMFLEDTAQKSGKQLMGNAKELIDVINTLQGINK